MFILFDLVFLLYALVYLPYLLLTKRWHPDFSQRFGIFPKKIQAQLGAASNIWVHAVSVGEVMAVEGFIRRLKERWPSHTVVCSVTTKTGYELAQKRFGQIACVIAAPLDFSFIARRFVRLIRPKLYIAAETEIWPNLFGRLHQEAVPIAIINGRISDRSFGRYQCIKALMKPVLAKVSVFAMQSDVDATRIKELGANPEKVFMVGNIKFDDISRDGPPTKPFGGGNGELWVAGSTHPGEEQIILDVFKQLPQDWRLVIAPRHVERAQEVMRLVVQAGLQERVSVIDTVGRLRDLYAQASLVFVGKSLCVGGGQNVIEPAAFAKAVIVGPMMENFRDIVACFKTDNALVQVNNTAEFEAVVKALAGDEQKRKALGLRARVVIDKNQGAGERTLKRIEPWL